MSQSKKKDTIFLKRQLLDSFTYNAIFIEPNRISTGYDHILESIPFDRNNYLRALNEQKDSGLTVQHFPVPPALPQDWISAWLYKGKYYAYKASEPWVNSRIHIADSAVSVNDFNDGIIPLLLRSAPKKLDESTWRIQTSHNTKNKIQTLLIHMIDPKNEIAVFEYPDKPIKERYTLMVNSKKIRNLPLIINYCESQRVLEWEFDKPDYEYLLKSKNK